MASAAASPGRDTKGSSGAVLWRWLHLSDIHTGCRGEAYRRQAMEAFRTDIVTMTGRLGPPDLILLTGDMANFGKKSEFDRFDAFLGELLGWLKKVAAESAPLVIPVPGNHDLVRPKGAAARPYSILKQFSLGDVDPDIKELRKEIWSSKTRPLFFHRLFKNYLEWRDGIIARHLTRDGVDVHRSPFPGDLSVRIDIDGRVPLTVVGLNGAWMQCAEGGYERRMELWAEQFDAAWGGFPRTTIGERAALLLIHHPRDWFSPASRGLFDELVYPPPRFVACLHGHMHEALATGIAGAGGQARTWLQAPSLFGLEHYGTARQDRRIGYAWGELRAGNEIRIWPRKYEPRGDGAGSFGFDSGFHGSDIDGVVVRPADSPRPGQSGDAGKALRPVAPTVPAEYRDWLQASVERVELLGAKEGRSVTLNYVYVPAVTRPQPEAGNEPMPGRMGTGEEQRPIPLLHRLDRESVYVPAPAGAGKSTFCRWAALQSVAGSVLVHPVPAPEDFAEPVPQELRRRLPVLVPLRDFGRRMDCGNGLRTWHRADLEKAVAAWIDASPPEGLTGELALAHLKAGSAFLLLDGLDEVAVTEEKEGVTVYPRELLLSGLADALPIWLKAGNRVLLTSRPYGLDDAGLHRLGLPRAELEPLPDKLQDLFVTRWFACLKKPRQTKDLIATIRGRDDLAPLAGNPMLLTALCVLYDNGGRLPEDRYDLYRSIVDGVLYSRYPGDAKEREPVARRLEAIALGMHVGEDRQPRATPAAEVSWAEVERRLAEFAERNPAYEAGQVEAACRREDLLNHSGLLVPRPNQRAAFYHLSFQEFLAAQRLARKPKDIDGVFLAHRAVPEWQATLVFLLAAHIANCDAQSGFDLIELLIGDQDRAAVKADPNPAVLVAEALELCLAKTYEVPEPLKERFQRLALDAIEDEITLPARQALGLCLGRLGDPRIRGLRDPDAYVEVPAGTYPYGEKGERVEIAAPFRIGRYPVTNGQFREFVDGGGYHERKWWLEEGWAWLEQGQVTEPRWWRDRRWNTPNQPVVGVSFWEAEACAAWAGGKLPTEQEWEAAARGPTGLAYPWGNDWADGIANTLEAGLHVTSPVGLFPRSHQAGLGIADLAGNVWEWCASLYDPGEAGGRRVLRGGSWVYARDSARSAFRNGLFPNVRVSYFGFRVVCSSLIAGF